MAKGRSTGLIIVYTGNGKGKTSAALGSVIRASGYGWKIFILQFVKGSWHYGEIDGIKVFEPDVVMEQMGKGFYKIMDDNLPEEDHKKAAKHGLERAREKMQSGDYKLVILDEINYAIDLGLLPLEDVVELLKQKPGKLNVILTGRNARKEIIDLADLVTEMKEIKHPFQKGLKARKGIDF
ncbi:cob(I)yrinic acid a,c-diamide adenosyltransferase [candidate division KSB1 bacterium]|nr:cob(I)yrinic acid a,c-diamide adenosyltransferase [candidate division KSB1 bacterium]